GLATANIDSSPVVAITGQVATGLIGRDAFQEVDIFGATIPVTKHNFLVTDIAKLPGILRQAFHIAGTGRPGPVLVDIPRDIQIGMLDFQPGPTLGRMDRSQPADNAQIEAAAAAIGRASRPVMIVGGGAVAANVSAELVAFSEKCSLPVVSTLMGLGAFPASHRHFLGLTGMHGLKPANRAIYNSDLIVAVGSRFSDRITGDRNKYMQGKTIIHLEIDPSEIDKNILTHVGIAGNLQLILKTLAGQVAAGDLKQWWLQIAEWQQQQAARPDNRRLTAPWLMDYIADQAGDLPCRFITDVGQHQMWAAQNLRIERPRQWITSGGMGTMGFGMPAAMGAQLADPGQRAVLIAGDGGFKMTGMELYTAVTHSLPIIVVVVDNRCLGMVRQWQQLFFNQRYSNSLFDTPFDFVGFARACGAWAARATSCDEFADAWKQAVDNRSGPSVIVADIDRMELVTPMIAPGASLDEYVKV
ncbi:MAG: thiamine pyrophosphate-dependent enzyme, partial [Negativicutes bacterium]|nr:thiamine pyrophosphate-dependent enzyme [Negativicutes bacterium]